MRMVITPINVNIVVVEMRKMTVAVCIRRARSGHCDTMRMATAIDAAMAIAMAVVAVKRNFNSCSLRVLFVGVSPVWVLYIIYHTATAGGVGCARWVCSLRAL